MTVLRLALLGTAVLSLLAFGFVAEYRAAPPPAARHALETERGVEGADEGPVSVPRLPGPVPSRPVALAAPSASGPLR